MLDGLTQNTYLNALQKHGSPLHNRLNKIGE